MMRCYGNQRDQYGRPVTLGTEPANPAEGGASEILKFYL